MHDLRRTCENRSGLKSALPRRGAGGGVGSKRNDKQGEKQGRETGTPTLQRNLMNMQEAYLASPRTPPSGRNANPPAAAARRRPPFAKGGWVYGPVWISR